MGSAWHVPLSWCLSISTGHRTLLRARSGPRNEPLFLVMILLPTWPGMNDAEVGIGEHPRAYSTSTHNIEIRHESAQLPAWHLPSLAISPVVNPTCHWEGFGVYVTSFVFCLHYYCKNLNKYLDIQTPKRYHIFIFVIRSKLPKNIYHFVVYAKK